MTNTDVYNSMYVVNVDVRSISGRHTITEDDLGLPTGTLPPEDVASLGRLITIDSASLTPFSSLRTKARRICGEAGVRVGMGTVVTPDAVDPLLAALKQLQTEFLSRKQEFLGSFREQLEKRIDAHPRYATLIKAFAPSYAYVEGRLGFEIDTFKIAAPQGDPRSDVLTETLLRPDNDITQRLFKETVSFVLQSFNRTMESSGTVTTRNLDPYRNTLLPKLRRFQHYASRCRPVADLLERLLDEADAALDAIPKGHHRALTGAAYDRWMDQFKVFLSVDRLDTYAACHKPAPGVLVVTSPAPKTAPVPVQMPMGLPPRQPVPPTPNGARRVVTF